MKQVLMEPEVIKNGKSKNLKEESVAKAKTLADLPGVGPATIEKLEAVGYNDLMSVAVATPGEIIDATGMTDAAAKKVIAMARASLEMGFESRDEILRKR